MTDPDFMEVALQQAALALDKGNWLVGATDLVPHGDHYPRKGLEIVAGVSADASQTLINEYVRRTGLRAHLSTERRWT